MIRSTHGQHAWGSVPGYGRVVVRQNYGFVQIIVKAIEAIQDQVSTLISNTKAARDNLTGLMNQLQAKYKKLAGTLNDAKRSKLLSEIAELQRKIAEEQARLAAPPASGAGATPAPVPPWLIGLGAAGAGLVIVSAAKRRRRARR